MVIFIIALGTGRRKVHKTQSSGFHIFKPILASGSGSRPSTYNRPRTDIMRQSNDNNHHRHHQVLLLQKSPRIKRIQKVWPWMHHLMKDTPPETPPKDERTRQNGHLPPVAFRSVSNSSAMSPVAVVTMKLPSVMEEMERIS